MSDDFGHVINISEKNGPHQVYANTINLLTVPSICVNYTHSMFTNFNGQEYHTPGAIA